MHNGIEVRKISSGWEIVLLPDGARFFSSDDEDVCNLIAWAYRKGYNKATWAIRDAVEEFKVI